MSRLQFAAPIVGAMAAAVLVVGLNQPAAAESNTGAAGVYQIHDRRGGYDSDAGPRYRRHAYVLAPHIVRAKLRRQGYHHIRHIRFRPARFWHRQGFHGPRYRRGAYIAAARGYHGRRLIVHVHPYSGEVIRRIPQYRRHLSHDDVVKRLLTMGYRTIERLSYDDDTYVAQVFDPYGKPRTVYMDAASGATRFQ